VIFMQEIRMYICGVKLKLPFTSLAKALVATLRHIESLACGDNLRNLKIGRSTAA